MMSFIFVHCFYINVEAQTYEDYFGEGNSVGVTVTSSDAASNDEAIHSLSGNGRFTNLEGASRFLAQATMGANYEKIQNVSQIGIDAWIDQQIALPPSSYAEKLDSIIADALTIIINPDDKNEYMSYAFYEMLVKRPDLLRQKVAFALSQIFVISPTNSLLSNRAYVNAVYYDILYQGAFGNYRDLLYQVSMHPAMGIYLSHYHNQKADIIQGTLPDENYAREIMQLFSIGLFELNNDGSFKLDANSNTIPTYDILDIQEISKVFTGLTGAPNGTGGGFVFGSGFGNYDLTQPMVLFQDYHDKQEKTLLDGSTLPANQSGMDDINQLIDHLFLHDNVGPFISIRLIQQLVKSNPSPRYINRVATVFNNNGKGVRGDMAAVIRAILTDEEARDCNWIDNPTSGKLLQPIERLTNLFLGFDIKTPSNRFWLRDEIDFYGKLEQSFLAAPTVFNFFSPFFAEQEFVEPNQLVSPEFQILNSTSGINYLNTMENALRIRPFINRTLASGNSMGLNYNSNDNPYLDFSDEINIFNTQGLSALIDRIDLIIARGQLSAEAKTIIQNTIQSKIDTLGSYPPLDVVEDVLYFILISPNYAILK